MLLSLEGQSYIDSINAALGHSNPSTDQGEQKMSETFEKVRNILCKCFGKRKLMMIRRCLSLDVLMKLLKLDEEGKLKMMTESDPESSSLFQFFVVNKSLSSTQFYDKTKDIEWSRLISASGGKPEHEFRRQVYNSIPEFTSVDPNDGGLRRNQYLVLFTTSEEDKLVAEGYDAVMDSIRSSSNPDPRRCSEYIAQRNAAQKFRKSFIDAYTTLRGVNSCCVWLGIDPDQICHASQSSATLLAVKAFNMRQACDLLYHRE
jgi:hypothetical protein